MDFFSFIIIATFISYISYSLLSSDDGDFLKKRLDKISNEKSDSNKTNRADEIRKFVMLFIKPILSNIAGKKEDSRSLKQLLVEAGKPSSDDDVLRFIAKRLLYSGIGFSFAAILVMMVGFDKNTMLLTLCIPPAGYIIPIFILRSQVQQRANEIAYNLPDALDLLTVCVEAGLGLDAALTRVAKEYSRTSEVLSGELDRVCKDILAGLPRQDAFRNLAKRNNVPDLQSLAALLIQTDKLGTSISQSLRVYCDTVRTRRKQRVEEVSQKASVKMIIPLVFFILPAMFIVILGPAAISLSQNMK